MMTTHHHHGVRAGSSTTARSVRVATLGSSLVLPLPLVRRPRCRAFLAHGWWLGRFRPRPTSRLAPALPCPPGHPPTRPPLIWLFEVKPVVRLAIGMKLIICFVAVLFGEPVCAFDVLDVFYQKPAKAAGFYLMLNRRVIVIKLPGGGFLL